MKLVKKLVVGAATLSLASGFYAIPVFAAADASNQDISGNSFADSKSEDDDKVKVDSVNDTQDLLNFDVAAASSGLNQQSHNEDGNELTASNTAAEYKTANFLNVNETVGSDGASAWNKDISDESDGDAYASDNDYIKVKNTNTDTTVFNLTASLANSGLNEQKKNEDGNTLVAGTAWSYAETSNVVNHNIVSGSCGEPACPGNGDPTAVAYNQNISNNSFADSKAKDDDKVRVYNTNTDTTVTNITASVSNSGGNTQYKNEDGNDMTTGATGASVQASNYVNVNETNVGGSSAVASNTNITGESDGDAYASDSDNIKVHNTNTNTSVTNVSAAVSNSGGNTQSGNEDGNTTTTGTAAAVGNTTNVVNSNSVSW